MDEITRRSVVNERYTTTGDGVKLADLDFDNWWTDNSKGMNFFHVKHKVEDTWHRVYCKKTDCPRLLMKDGKLMWIIDSR